MERATLGDPARAPAITRRRTLGGAALAVSGGLLGAACGASGGDTGGAASKSVTPVQIAYTDWEPTDGAQIQETVIQQFRQKAAHVSVEYQKNPDTYVQKIQTLFVAGTPPDAFALSQPDLVQLMAQGSVAEVDVYIKRDAKEVDAGDFFKPHLEGWRVGGKQMGLPRDGGGVVVYYNKSLFDAQGITPPANGYTWDEWLDVARRVAVKDGPAGAIYGATRNGPADWLHWVWQNGGDFLDQLRPAVDRDHRA